MLEQSKAILARKNGVKSISYNEDEFSKVAYFKLLL